MTLGIENGMIVTLDSSARVLERGHVTISGDLIETVNNEPAAGSDVSDRLDASDGVVMPGLLNAHTHSPENLARGAVDRVAFENWAAVVWPALDRLAPKEIRIAVLLGCCEMLRTGTTAVVDHFRQTPMSLAAIEAAVDAYREAGMRFAVAIMLRDRVMPPWANDVPRVADVEEMCRAAIVDWHDPAGLGTIMLAPSAPHRCTDRLLEMVAALGRERRIHIQMHVDETCTQRREADETYGHSSIRHLDPIGLLNDRVSLAHCVWVDDADLDLLAKTATTVVHNPMSNLRLGSGIAPVPAMLDRGIAVALGADGAASNDSQDMFETMKMASLLQGAIGPAARPTAHDVLRMATGQSGERFGMAGIGGIAAGRKADIVVFERADARLYPLNDIHRQIVFCGGLTVRHVVVGGRVVVRDGQIQTFDEKAVYAEADKLTARYATRSH